MEIGSTFRKPTLNGKFCYGTPPPIAITMLLRTWMTNPCPPARESSELGMADSAAAWIRRCKRCTDRKQLFG